MMIVLIMIKKKKEDNDNAITAIINKQKSAKRFQDK